MLSDEVHSEIRVVGDEVDLPVVAGLTQSVSDQPNWGSWVSSYYVSEAYITDTNTSVSDQVYNLDTLRPTSSAQFHGK